MSVPLEELAERTMAIRAKLLTLREDLRDYRATLSAFRTLSYLESVDLLLAQAWAGMKNVSEHNAAPASPSLTEQASAGSASPPSGLTAGGGGFPSQQ